MQNISSACTAASELADSDQRIAVTVSPLCLIMTTRVLRVAQDLYFQCADRLRAWKAPPSSAMQKRMDFAVHSASRRKTSLLLLPLPMSLSSGMPVNMIAGCVVHVMNMNAAV